MTDPNREVDLAGVRDVACMFPDVNAVPRGKIRPAADFAGGVELRIAEAIGLHTIDGNYPDDDITGDSDQDVRLVPDLRSLRVLPWRPSRAIAIHDAVHFDGRPSDFAARAVLLRVMEAYRAQGLSAVVAPEIEFYLFDRNDRIEAGFEAPRGRGGVREQSPAGYSLDAGNEHAAFWDELAAALVQLGVRTDTWLHEVGQSQYEINLLHGDPLDLADQVIYFKMALREIAARHGLLAVFMAKPVAGQPGSSMHLHQSVVDAAGRNIFADAASGADTQAFDHYIGGLQRYMPDLMLFFAPYVNSWRRYVVGSQAPVNLEWAEDNRTVALRVPTSGASARRVENRLAGSDANPYLVIAASLACGLRGIREGLPRRESIGARSAYSYPRELPLGIEDAIARLQNSESAAQALGAGFLRAYCGVKQTEFNAFMGEIGAWERRHLALQA
ncbi:glutamine synthetase family protein [Niveibacterium sp. 24ML]|uniref:glutamine synthetase family protein n=1 Tax=Niveibacterium sp. 24ML TaxID=2985512 RepID=UPI00226DCF21|nr:glutamine synthetase family protein [Niveibacterium sp. 24ML]MCX9155308.1 glutamine synthetase family protein [Niveibacterium sp. 24ML]